MIQRWFGRVSRTLWSAAIAAAGLSCALAGRRVSDYDEITDRAVTGLQFSVDSFLINLAREPRPPACTHERHKNFYAAIFTSASAMRVRNRARPRNELTLQQLDLLHGSLTAFELLHAVKGDSTCLTPEEIEPLRVNLNTTFTAILTLEIAKRRG